MIGVRAAALKPSVQCSAAFNVRFATVSFGSEACAGPAAASANATASASGLQVRRTAPMVSSSIDARTPPQPDAVLHRDGSAGEADRATGQEAVAGGDLIDHGLRHRRVGRDGHHRDVGAASVLARRLAAHRGVGDVDAVLAEAGADAPDHAGDVAVAEEREVLVVHLEVEALAPGL